MRLHRFIGDYDLSQKKLRLTDNETIRQVRNVLRLGVGDFLMLVERGAGEARCSITNLGDAFLEVEVLEHAPAPAEALRSVALYCAALKRDNFEFVAQKATEAGVARIVPVRTERTIKQNLNHVRLEKIVKEAAEQSGRTTVPAVGEVMPFSEAIVDAQAVGRTVIACDASGEPFSALARDIADEAALFVGPEGGWSEEELAAMRGAGCAVMSLGALMLRAETAATVASYLVCQQKNV